MPQSQWFWKNSWPFVHEDRQSLHRCTSCKSVVSLVTMEQGTLVPGSKHALGCPQMCGGVNWGGDRELVRMLCMCALIGQG